MPHFKCEACKTRLYSGEGPTDLAIDLCPDCGALLEPVGELAEVVGFRSIKPRDGAADGGVITRRPLADRVGDLIARRDAILARARLDAERWVDDGGNFRSEAVPSTPTGDELMHATAEPSAERYRCLCEHVFQVFGLGRHRRYYELADRSLERPVMGRVCPSCQRRLPGENPPHATGEQVVGARAPAQFGGRKRPLGNRPVLLAHLESLMLMRGKNSHEAPILRRRPLVAQVIKRQKSIGALRGTQHGGPALGHSVRGLDPRHKANLQHVVGSKSVPNARSEAEYIAELSSLAAEAA